MPKNDLEKRLKTAVADAAKLIELEAGKEYIIQTAGRMEKMMEKIERDDLIRLREIAKKRAENAKNKGEHHHSSGMSGMSGMGGMGAIGGMMR